MSTTLDRARNNISNIILLCLAICLYTTMYPKSLHASKIFKSCYNNLATENANCVTSADACSAAVAQGLVSFNELYTKRHGLPVSRVGCKDGFATFEIKTSDHTAMNDYASVGMFCSRAPAERQLDNECVSTENQYDRSIGDYCLIGNPIDPISVYKLEYRLDLQIGQTDQLKFERSYTSRIDNQLSANGKSRLGVGWRSNFDSTLLFVGARDSDPVRIHIISPAGTTFTFVRSTDSNNWVRGYFDSSTKWWRVDPTASVEKLSKNGPAYEFTDRFNRTWTFDDTGKLVKIMFLGGISKT